MMNNKIEALQKEIREKQEELIKLRLAQPLEEVKDYTFTTKEGHDMKLSDLFEGKDELLVIHNMGKSCRYCTMWADGFSGYSEIISDRMPWVLTSPDDFETMETFASPRGWNFNYVSFSGTSFALDLGFQYTKNERIFYQPGVSALIMKEGKMYRTARDSFGPGDMFNPAWHFFDLFPKGINGWAPKYKYDI